MRRHEISSGLLYHWKGPYNRGRLDNPPTHEAALEERVRQLEQPVGRLTLENEFLKKAVQRSLAPPKRSGGSSLSIVTSYHKSKSRPDGQKALIARIEAVIEEFPGYGYRRVTGVLHRRGFRDNRKKVLRVMREQELTRKPGRRRVRTTNSEHAHRVRGDVQPNEILSRCPNRICLTGGGSSTQPPTPGES
jgi:hypothetical protein